MVWRSRWEATHDEMWKQKLITYNLEDRAALRQVTELSSCSAQTALQHTNPEFGLSGTNQCPFHGYRKLINWRTTGSGGGSTLSTRITSTSTTVPTF